MRRYLSQLPNEYEDQLNMGLVNKSFDKELTDYIFKSFKGFEILPNIKVLGYEWVSDEEKYDVNDHVIRRNSNKNKAIKSIAESRCGVMYIDFEVSGLDKNGARQIYYIKKPVVVPIADDYGYYLLKGKKCYAIYQLVDKMLYPSFGAVTVKSLMPICVKTIKDEFTDMNGNTYVIPTYTIQIFKNSINVLLIYSNLGITKTLNFLEINKFVHIESKEKEYPVTDKVIKFDCGKKSDIIVTVRKDIFDDNIYVRSMVGCLIKLFADTKIEYDRIDSWDDWMIIVGGKNTVTRGQYQHIFFNRLLDDVTREELPINEYDKQNIYYLLRWILQNYHTMWAKDNLAMTNKRLRSMEMLGTYATSEVSKRINRIASLGSKATIQDYLKLFRFPEDIILTKIYSSGVLRYAENNSDMDMSMKYKYTAKGPRRIGTSSSNCGKFLIA